MCVEVNTWSCCTTCRGLLLSSSSWSSNSTQILGKSRTSLDLDQAAGFTSVQAVARSAISRSQAAAVPSPSVGCTRAGCSGAVMPGRTCELDLSQLELSNHHTGCHDHLSSSPLSAEAGQLSMPRPHGVNRSIAAKLGRTVAQSRCVQTPGWQSWNISAAMWNNCRCCEEQQIRE